MDKRSEIRLVEAFVRFGPEVGLLLHDADRERPDAVVRGKTGLIGLEVTTVLEF
jgi:hypothetical protein